MFNYFFTEFSEKVIKMWEVVERLMQSKGMKISDLSRATGISYSTFTDWKAGRSTPKADKLKKIADFFSVSVEYILTGGTSDYYFSPEAAETAQFLMENENYRILFDAIRKVSPNDLKFVMEMVDRLKS